MATRKVTYELEVVNGANNAAAFKAILDGNESVLQSMRNRASVVQRIEDEASERRKQNAERATQVELRSHESVLQSYHRKYEGQRKADQDYTALWQAELTKRDRASISFFEHEKQRREQSERDALQTRNQEVAIDQKRYADRQADLEAAFGAQDRAIAEATRNYEQAHGQMKAADAQLIEGMFGVTESVGRVARGFTLLGFAADDDLQKLIKQLSVVQGIADIVLGGAKAYDSLRKAVEGYRSAVQAAAAAEAASAAIRQASALTGGTGSAGRTTTAVASAGGSALSGAGGLAGVGSVAGPALAAAAALASVATALKMVHETATAASRTSEDLADTWADSWIATFGRITGSGDATGDHTRAYESREATRRAQRRTAELQEQLANREREENRGRELGRIDTSERSALRSSEREGFNASLEFLNRDERRGALQGRLADVQNAAPTDDQDVMKERLEEERRLRVEIYNLEKEARQEKIQGADQALQKAQQELSVIRQSIATREESMKSAAERFADLDPAEQERLRRIQKKAKESGAESLTREERIALRGIGTEDTAQTARESAEADLRRRGIDFESEFGQRDRERTEELRKKSEKLTAEVDLQTEVVATLQVDEEQARRVIREALAPLQSELQRMVREEVKRSAEEQRAATNDNFDRQAAARRGLMGQGIP